MKDSSDWCRKNGRKNWPYVGDCRIKEVSSSNWSYSTVSPHLNNPLRSSWCPNPQSTFSKELKTRTTIISSVGVQSMTGCSPWSPLACFLRKASKLDRHWNTGRQYLWVISCGPCDHKHVSLCVLTLTSYIMCFSLKAVCYKLLFTCK